MRETRDLIINRYERGSETETAMAKTLGGGPNTNGEQITKYKLNEEKKKLAIKEIKEKRQAKSRKKAENPAWNGHV